MIHFKNIRSQELMIIHCSIVHLLCQELMTIHFCIIFSQKLMIIQSSIMHSKELMMIHFSIIYVANSL